MIDRDFQPVTPVRARCARCAAERVAIGPAVKPTGFLYRDYPGAPLHREVPTCAAGEAA